MPRPSHLPTYREREALILLHDHGELPLRKLHPAGQTTLAKMIDKMWVERIGLDTYRITSGGSAALKAKLPPDYRPRSL